MFQLVKMTIYGSKTLHIDSKNLRIPMMTVKNLQNCRIISGETIRRKIVIQFQYTKLPLAILQIQIFNFILAMMFHNLSKAVNMKIIFSKVVVSEMFIHERVSMN